MATIPAGVLREQDVELAATDPAHRAVGQLRDVEHGLEGGVRAAERGEVGRECRRSGVHRFECYPRGTNNGPGGVHRGRRVRGGAKVSRRRPFARRPVPACPSEAAGRPEPAVCVGTGASLELRSGISLIATAAAAAATAPSTPSQKVWAVAMVKAPWMPSTIAPMNGVMASWNSGGTLDEDHLTEVADAGQLTEVQRAARARPG